MPKPRIGITAETSRIGTEASKRLLELIWLASPALPVGGFSYSEGLEAAVEAGRVVDEASAARWLEDQLVLVLARSDLAAFGTAIDAWRRVDLATIADLNRWIAATRETGELRRQTLQMGHSMVEWLRCRARAGAAPTAAIPTRSDDRATAATAFDAESCIDALAALPPGPTWPIAAALGAARTGADVRDALLALAFGWAENLVQAAVRAIPLGQSAGQRVLGALLEPIVKAVDHALALPAAERQAHAPMLAIHSARHETQYSRLFRS